MASVVAMPDATMEDASAPMSEPILAAPEASTSAAVKDEQPEAVDEAEPAAESSEPPVPAGPAPVETLYVRNLNEKISTKVMKQTLRNLFRQYGVVLDVVAHRNLRMRGQAFVAMTDRAAAARAVKEVRGFPLYGKPIDAAFARTPADAVVKQKTPKLLEVHLEERKKRKKTARRRNPLRAKAAAAQYAAKNAAAGVPTEGVAAAAPKRNIVQMPDEYLPPNKILFIQNLPDTTTKEQLEELFKPYPNLHDIRTIPGRKGIAFVEYTDEASSTAAREALHNHKVDEDHKMKVTFAKQ